MYCIKDSFVDYNGRIFKNVRDIHFDSLKETYGNFGSIVAESNHKSSGFMGFDDDKVYIYKSKYDLNKALRIYSDYGDYKYTFHDDDRLIEELQKRQSSVKLTEFPTGIVSVEGKVIGQEIIYYENYKTIYECIVKSKNISLTGLYLQVLKILKELVENEIIYRDVHAGNFLVDETDSIVRLIDFESRLIATYDSPSSKDSMIMNLKCMLNKLNEIRNIEFDFSKIETLDEMEEYILEKHV